MVHKINRQIGQRRGFVGMSVPLASRGATPSRSAAARLQAVAAARKWQLLHGTRWDASSSPVLFAGIVLALTSIVFLLVVRERQVATPTVEGPYDAAPVCASPEPLVAVIEEELQPQQLDDPPKAPAAVTYKSAEIDAKIKEAQALYNKALEKEGPERKQALTKAMGILGTCTNAMEKERSLWMTSKYDEWQQRVPQLLSDVTRTSGF
jgi:hypothetical protein